MAYPPEYLPEKDLANAQLAGDVMSATEVYSELSRVAGVVNQLTSFIRALSTANKKFKPNTFVGTFESEIVTFTATAAQTVFDFSASLTVDPVSAEVFVFVNGALLDPALVTLNAGDVVIPATTAGDIVVVQLFDGAASVLAQLAAITSGLGASLIGLEDAAGLIASSNVEGALAENRTAINALTTAIGDISKYLKADVAVEWEVHQDAGGKRLEDLGPGVANTDAATIGQVSSLLADVTNLFNKFLPRAGGVMSGPINMNGQRLINLPEPVAASDPVRLEDLNAAEADRLALNGTKTSLADGTLTGPVTLSSASADVVADADQTGGGDLSTVTQNTLYEVPQAGADDQVVNKKQMDTADTTIQQQVTSLVEQLDVPIVKPGGCSLDLIACTCIDEDDINLGGTFNFDENWTIGVATAPVRDLIIYVEGDMILNANMVVASGHFLKLYCSGHMTLNANIQASDITIIATGGITQNVGKNINCRQGVLDLRASGDSSLDGTITNTKQVEVGITGNLTVSNTWTVSFVGSGGLGIGANSEGDAGEGRYGGGGGDNTGLSGGGGGGGGTGGGAGQAGEDAGPAGSESLAHDTFRPYLFPMHAGGGGGGGEDAPAQADLDGGDGGGAVSVWVDGDALLTGSLFDVSGGDGDDDATGGVDYDGGGGGGGAARVSCTGTLTDGTIDATGGDGTPEDGEDKSGGAGGGGGAYFLAAIYAGTQSVDATAGTGVGGVGNAGMTAVDTQTAEQLRCLREQAVI